MKHKLAHIGQVNKKNTYDDITLSGKFRIETLGNIGEHDEEEQNNIFGMIFEYRYAVLVN